MHLVMAQLTPSVFLRRWSCAARVSPNSRPGAALYHALPCVHGRVPLANFPRVPGRQQVPRCLQVKCPGAVRVTDPLPEKNAPSTCLRPANSLLRPVSVGPKLFWRCCLRVLQTRSQSAKEANKPSTLNGNNLEERTRIPRKKYKTQQRVWATLRGKKHIVANRMKTTRRAKLNKLLTQGGQQ